ncbi:hypothetical protein ACO0LB_17090 [Undibacterium sp. SXout7W]|uniref:hypothetical protein n=1 Tax=Undibacterium sp. SXout7W TaxID=3413049 RepID=UPI003BF45747
MMQLSISPQNHIPAAEYHQIQTPRAGQPESTEVGAPSTRSKAGGYAKSWGKILGRNAVSVGLATAVRELVRRDALVTYQKNHPSGSHGWATAAQITPAVFLGLGQIRDMVKGEHTTATTASRVALIGFVAASTLAIQLNPDKMKDAEPALIAGAFLYPAVRDLIQFFWGIENKHAPDKLTLLPGILSAVAYFANQTTVGGAFMDLGVESMLPAPPAVTATLDTVATALPTSIATTLAPDLMKKALANIAVRVPLNIVAEALDDITLESMLHVFNNPNKKDKPLEIQYSTQKFDSGFVDRAIKAATTNAAGRSALMVVVYNFVYLADQDLMKEVPGKDGATWGTAMVGAAVLAGLYLAFYGMFARGKPAAESNESSRLEEGHSTETPAVHDAAPVAERSEAHPLPTAPIQAVPGPTISLPPSQPEPSSRLSESDYLEAHSLSSISDQGLTIEGREDAPQPPPSSTRSKPASPTLADSLRAAAAQKTLSSKKLSSEQLAPFQAAPAPSTNRSPTGASGIGSIHDRKENYLNALGTQQHSPNVGSPHNSGKAKPIDPRINTYLRAAGTLGEHTPVETAHQTTPPAAIETSGVTSTEENLTQGLTATPVEGNSRVELASTEENQTEEVAPAEGNAEAKTVSSPTTEEKLEAVPAPTTDAKAEEKAPA